MQIILPDYIPPPCQRPRVGKGGHAYSPSSKPEQSLAWMLLADISRQNITAQLPYDGPCYLQVALFYRKNQPIRGDLDNILKFIMDAMQKAAIIKNDRLFHGLHISASPASQEATILYIEPYKPIIKLPPAAIHKAVSYFPTPEYIVEDY